MAELDFVTIKKLADLTGYTTRAIQSKLYEGVWQEGRHYRKAPDGRVHISLKAYSAWVEGKQVGALPA
jgi:hypothetical protein